MDLSGAGITGLRGGAMKSGGAGKTETGKSLAELMKQQKVTGGGYGSISRA